MPVAQSMKRINQNAYQEAIEKAGVPYDALVNATQTTSGYLAAIHCATMKGTAVKYEGYHGTESGGTAKPSIRLLALLLNEFPTLTLRRRKTLVASAP